MRTAFGRRLALVAVAAFALRVAYVLLVATHNPEGGDPLFYHLQANLLAHGHGFAEPFVWLLQHGRITPSAVHPPGYTTLLAIPSFLGADGFLAHKLVSAVAGTAGVVVAGLLGRRLAGERAGIVAAVAVALCPNLWVIDGVLMPEGLLAVTVAVVLLVAYRFDEEPSWPRAAVLGAAVGVAALVRSESVLLVPLLVVPLALVTRRVRLIVRVGLVAVAALATVVVLAPWQIRNLTAFHEPVILSTNGDEVIGNANCDVTYHGDLLGFWSTACYDVLPPPTYDESQRATYWRHRGLDYVRAHRDRIPAVVAARVGRVWDVYRPLQNARLSGLEGRDLHVSWAGLAYYWASVPLAVWGLVRLRRRGVRLLPVLAPLAAVTITAATAYGVVRFRAPADLVLAMLAGVALASLGTRPGDAPAPAAVREVVPA